MTMTPDDREFIDQGKTLLKQEWHGSYEEEQTKMFLGLILTKYEALLSASVAPQGPTSERCDECGDKLDYVAGLDGQGCYSHCWRCWYKDHPVETAPAQVAVDEALLAEASTWADEQLPPTPWGDSHVVHRLITALRGGER